MNSKREEEKNKEYTARTSSMKFTILKEDTCEFNMSKYGDGIDRILHDNLPFYSPIVVTVVAVGSSSTSYYGHSSFSNHLMLTSYSFNR